MITKCDKCNSKDTYVLNYEHNIIIKGKNISFIKERRLCSKCNSLVYDHNLDNAALKEAYRLYNLEYGVPADEIKKLRSLYNLSIEDFAKIIGCAKKTLVSYENGNSTPNDIYLVTIKTLIDNPEIIKNMIESNRERFTDSEYDKITSRISSFFSTNMNNLISDESSDLNEYNGYTLFNKNKMINLIKILSKDGINKTKLLKEMFYSDFYVFYSFSYSLTGLLYTKLPYGPVPDEFESLLKYLSINGEINYEVLYKNEYEEHIITNSSEIDYSIFTDEELSIINKIINKFKSFKVKDIVEYSHNERAFTETELLKPISYDYALDLKEI